MTYDEFENLRANWKDEIYGLSLDTNDLYVLVCELIEYTADQHIGHIRAEIIMQAKINKLLKGNSPNTDLIDEGWREQIIPKTIVGVV